MSVFWTVFQECDLQNVATKTTSARNVRLAFISQDTETLPLFILLFSGQVSIIQYSSRYSECLSCEVICISHSFVWFLAYLLIDHLALSLLLWSLGQLSSSTDLKVHRYERF